VPKNETSHQPEEPASLQEVCRASAELSKTVEEHRAVTQAYISIAMKHPTEGNIKSGRCSFAQMDLNKEAAGISGKVRVPVLTCPVAVQPDTQYGELPHVKRVSPAVDFVGGVNMPKKMSVIDSFNQVRFSLDDQGVKGPVAG
jgi:hypothetical protein